ncbi:MAG: hypothetical protein ACM3PF_05645 [Bacteroidota bacterium]
MRTPEARAREIWIVRHTVLLLGCLMLSFSSAVPTRAQEAAPPEAPLRIVLTGGDTLRAIRILPSGLDMLRIDDATGRGYYPATHVRRVLDETGADRTHDALDRRRFLGLPLPGEPVPEKPGVRPVRPSHYGPLSVTRTFPIVETAMFLNTADPRYARRGTTYTFDLGRGVNVGARDAVGMTLFGGAGGGAYDLGVRYRYRRWLGAQSSVDVAPGLIFAHDEPGAWEGRGLGLVGQVSLNATPWFSFGVQAFSVGRKLPGSYTWYGSYPRIYDRDSGVMLGFKLGGTPAIVAGAVGGVIALSFPPEYAVPVARR